MTRLTNNPFLCTLLALAGRAAASFGQQDILQAPIGAKQLSDGEFAVYAPYTQLAKTAYCDLERVKAWNCGASPSPVSSSVACSTV